MTKQRLDITGQKYGRLTVIKEVKSNSRHRKWLCRCECGNTVFPFMYSLRNGSTQSCGCLRKEKSRKANVVDLTGKRFGKLTVLKPTNRRDKSRNIIWLCKCDCGNERYIVSKNLTSGETKSCGCLMKESGKN